MNSSAITLWTGLFPIAGYLVRFYYDCSMVVPELNANSVDPDQTPVASGSTPFDNVPFICI